MLFAYMRLEISTYTQNAVSSHRYGRKRARVALAATAVSCFGPASASVGADLFQGRGTHGAVPGSLRVGAAGAHWGLAYAEVRALVRGNPTGAGRDRERRGRVRGRRRRAP